MTLWAGWVARDFRLDHAPSRVLSQLLCLKVRAKTVSASLDMLPICCIYIYILYTYTVYIYIYIYSHLLQSHSSAWGNIYRKSNNNHLQQAEHVSEQQHSQNQKPLKPRPTTSNQDLKIFTSIMHLETVAFLILFSIWCIAMILQKPFHSSAVLSFRYLWSVSPLIRIFHHKITCWKMSLTF